MLTTLLTQAHKAPFLLLIYPSPFLPLCPVCSPAAPFCQCHASSSSPSTARITLRHPHIFHSKCQRKLNSGRLHACLCKQYLYEITGVVTEACTFVAGARQAQAPRPLPKETSTCIATCQLQHATWRPPGSPAFIAVTARSGTPWAAAAASPPPPAPASCGHGRRWGCPARHTT